MLTGIDSVDTLHQSVFGHASHLTHCADFEVPEIYRSLVATVEQTFAHEHRLMEESGFPVMHCHLEQHARVLAALHETHPAVMRGDCDTARKVGGHLLPDWLQLHIATQDVTLSIWIAYSQNPAIPSKESNPGRSPEQIAHAPYCELIYGAIRQQRDALQPEHRQNNPLL